MWEFLLPLLGLLIGILAAMIGVGGGIIIVPILTLFYSVIPATAVGTSLTIIFFTAITVTISYHRQKLVYYKIGIAIALTTSPGAILGAYLTTLVSPDLLGIILGFFLISVAIKIMYDFYIKHRVIKAQSTYKVNEKVFNNRSDKLALCAALGFFAGIASGLLGLGGGIILVPLMVYILSIDMRFAVATSMFTMIFTSLSGISQYYLLGNINFEYAALLGTGSIIGGIIGTLICRRTSNTKLSLLFALILLAVSIEMTIKFLCLN